MQMWSHEATSSNKMIIRQNSSAFKFKSSPTLRHLESWEWIKIWWARSFLLLVERYRLYMGNDVERTFVRKRNWNLVSEKILVWEIINLQWNHRRCCHVILKMSTWGRDDLLWHEITKHVCLVYLPIMATLATNSPHNRQRGKQYNSALI